MSIQKVFKGVYLIYIFYFFLMMLGSWFDTGRGASPEETLVTALLCYSYGASEDCTWLLSQNCVNV